MAVSTLALVLAAALGAAGAPRPDDEPPPPPGAQPTHVVVRTRGDVFTGHGLRYKSGEFSLLMGKGEVSIPEARVLCINFVNLPHDEQRDPVIGLALLMAHPRRAPLLKRFVAAYRLREGIFILPDEPVEEVFRRTVPKVRHPELVAVLCLEAARRCGMDKKPLRALELFKDAEAEAKDRSAHAFLYGLMQAAVLFERERDAEAEGTLDRLLKAYPTVRRPILKFRALNRIEDDIPKLLPRLPAEP